MEYGRLPMETIGSVWYTTDHGTYPYVLVRAHIERRESCMKPSKRVCERRTHITQRAHTGPDDEGGPLTGAVCAAEAA